jgi:tetratricopeptide (TPR) repeat protein
MKHFLILISLAVSLGACATLDPQPDQVAGTTALAPVVTPSFQEPIDLLPEVTGPLSWRITTGSLEAQAYFDQGFQLRFAYGVDEAARSFREAHEADPTCAMCYWGEAFALGSYLNGGMTVEKAPYALAAIRRAAELAETNATAMEKDLIEATAVRYVEGYALDMRRSLDEAFAESMRQVHETYPDELNITAIYASALFLLEPRRGTRDLDDPGVMRLHAVLEDGLAKDVTHPGLCHLYVHATESTERPGLAEPCAAFLSDGIPGASHIQHMPSHTWNEVGRWGDSVVANTNAWHSDLKAAVGEGVAIYPIHNLRMLLFAASMDGQGAVATQAGKDLAKIGGGTMQQVLTLLRFGRFDEILEVTDRSSDDVGGGFWDFAHGYARLRMGDSAAANASLEKVRELARHSEATYGVHAARQLMGLAAAILEGEILRERGDLPGAIAAFQTAAAFDDQQEYDEPEPIPFAARHWLGAALMEAGRYGEAETEYRTELADHPHNVWSLHGLKSALEAQGTVDPAADEDFAESTARSDTWITASRF